jgi:hypothetical protein
VRRGFKDKEKDKDKIKEPESEEKPIEITHVVFVIHGIAQKLYENSIIKNAEELATDLFCFKIYFNV